MNEPVGAGYASPAGAPPASVASTIPLMFWEGVERRGDEIILRQKLLGIWRPMRWRELGRIAREIGLGLVSLGFQPGEIAAILSNTRREWMMADLGVLGAGGVCSGIYPTDAPAQVEFVMTDSGATFLFVEDEEQLDKALSVRASLPRLRRIVVFDTEGLRDLADPQVISLDDLRALGRGFHEKHPGLWADRLRARAPEDLAVLIYTSGTTGRPKGAMLSHRNVLSTIRAFQFVLSQSDRDERICFLPLCHAVERIGGVYLALYTGARLNFVENPDTLPENVREISPTVLLAVPRVWEKFFSATTIALKEATPFEQWAYRIAIGVGYRVARLREDWKPVSRALRLLFRLMRFLVLDNLRRAIGIHRARLLITGAAPISPELIRWYMALGLEMIEMWGQTEATGVVTANPPGRIRPGTIGTPVQGLEVRLSGAGELLVRGEGVFMGYLNQPEKSAEALADGWLHTGDVGSVDEQGYFRITDRMKDIIITAGGKNVTPSEIENRLKFSPYITDAVVIGDRRPYLTALVMIDHDNVEHYAQEHAIPFSDFASLCRCGEIRDLIQREIDAVNRNFARVEQLKQYRLIEQKLTAEDEELTPTMKLKRALVNRKYHALIEEMYAG